MSSCVRVEAFVCARAIVSIRLSFQTLRFIDAATLYFVGNERLRVAKKAGILTIRCLLVARAHGNVQIVADHAHVIAQIVFAEHVTVEVTVDVRIALDFAGRGEGRKAFAALKLFKK